MGSEEKTAVLEQMEGLIGGVKTPEEYMKCTKEGLAQVCCVLERSNDIFVRRYEAARAVIDIIARQVGIDPDDTSYWLYGPDEDWTTPISDRLESWFDKSGEKAKLKRRLQELEQENAVLRSLLQK